MNTAGIFRRWSIKIWWNRDVKVIARLVNGGDGERQSRVGAEILLQAGSQAAAGCLELCNTKRKAGVNCIKRGPPKTGAVSASAEKRMVFHVSAGIIGHGLRTDRTRLTAYTNA